MKSKISGLKYVKIIKGRYYFHPYIAKKDRGQIETDAAGRAKTTLLGKTTDPEHKIVAAYSAALQQLEWQKAPERLTLFWLSKQYQDSRSFKKKEPETQRTYCNMEKAILEHLIEVNNEQIKVGEIDSRLLTTVDIRTIIDSKWKWYQDNNYHGGSQCNQQLSYLATLYKHGMQYIPELAQLPKNPVHGIETFETNTCTRLVTDEEYQIQYDVAAENPANGLCILFELTLGLAARGVEALDLKLSDCQPEGILVRRRKKSLTNLIEWSADPAIPKEESRLYQAYLSALERHKKHKILPDDPPLLISRKGDKLGASGLQSAMVRLRKKLADRGLNDVFWTMHMLKHKAITESEDKRMAGHKTEAMRQRYDHSIERFKPGV